VARTQTAPPAQRVCPWWLIRTFDNPLRRLLQRPEKILQDVVRPGDACLDLGCGIGYFTIPMARLVGPSGSVTAADVQPEMLAGVRRRAERSGLSSRIRLQRVDASGLQLDGPFDFALAFWMLHEVPDQGSVLRQVRVALKPGGRLMLVEPWGHVGQAAFDQSVRLAEGAGFAKVGDPRVFYSRAVLMVGRSGPAA
jgi:ubiquinone/menaquinone biosynthesis C-methylase UbiE